MSASQMMRSAFSARPTASRARRGKTLVTVEIVCADLGTQTSKRPNCSASSVASATSSGVRTFAARDAPTPVVSSVPTMLGMTTLMSIAASMLRSSPRSASLRPTTACLVAT